MTTPIDVVVFKSRNNFLREIGKIVHYLPGNNKISATCRTVATAPKIRWGKPQHLAHTVPDFIQIGSLPAELGLNERVKIVLLAHSLTSNVFDD